MKEEQIKETVLEGYKELFKKMPLEDLLKYQVEINKHNKLNIKENQQCLI